jgi:hypothetical protein
MTRSTNTVLPSPGFQSPNYTPVPDELFDVYLTELSGAELKVLLYIIRRTFGFKRESDNIALSQMMTGITTRDGRVLDRGVGLSKKTLLAALRALEDRQLIFSQRRQSQEKGNEPTSYRLNVRNAPPPPSFDAPHDPSSPGGGGEETTPPLGEKLHQGVGGKTTPSPWGKNSPTQETEIQETVLQHNVGVVTRETLEQFGITRTVAARLAATYPEAYLLTKLDLVQWLVATKSPLVGKNPAGYLRRAIEEDYRPPPKYQPAPEREAEARGRQRAEQSEQERRRQAEEEYRRAREHRAQALRMHYPPQPIPGANLATDRAWQQALAQLREQVTGPIFHLWLASTTLVSCDGQTATVAAPSRWHAGELAERLDRPIRQTLTSLIGKPVVCQYVSLTDLVPPESDANPLDTRSSAASPSPTGGEVPGFAALGQVMHDRVSEPLERPETGRVSPGGVLLPPDPQTPLKSRPTRSEPRSQTASPPRRGRPRKSAWHEDPSTKRSARPIPPTHSPPREHVP